jgi:hypothetical protein
MLMDMLQITKAGRHIGFSYRHINSFCGNNAISLFRIKASQRSSRFVVLGATSFRHEKGKMLRSPTFGNRQSCVIYGPYGFRNFRIG